jgi:hypothetical protein
VYDSRQQNTPRKAYNSKSKAKSYIYVAFLAKKKKIPGRRNKGIFIMRFFSDTHTPCLIAMKHVSHLSK